MTRRGWALLAILAGFAAAAVLALHLADVDLEDLRP